MYGIRRQKIQHHRIQAGKAIISIRLTNGQHVVDPGYQAMEWVGDGYELLEELQKAIRILEEKKRRREL